MCFCVYLAASRELPLIPFQGPVGNGKISTRPLHEQRQAVRQKFILLDVVAVGSDRGCGCGFRHDEAIVDFFDPTDPQPNHEALVSYLREHCSVEPFVELYGCWDGDHAQDLQDRREIDLSELANPRFHFRMNGYCKVRVTAPSPQAGNSGPGNC